MPDITMKTPCELAAMYRSKIVARRWLATMADMLVLLVICGGIGAATDPRSTALSITLFFGVPAVYYIVCETVFGRTLGKLVTGLIVINARGTRPSVGEAVIRTLTRFIEVNPVLFGGLPAGIIADRSRCRQRIGDMLAGTYVVFAKDLALMSAENRSESV
jgi:uncharacterized RDD family membrane protein YckC